MKTLEQLGISPTPLSVDNHNNIRTGDGHTLLIPQGKHKDKVPHRRA